MNYIGSKYKLSSFLKKTITDVLGCDLSQKVFCDLFAGTGIVGRSFKNDVKQIISNDREAYSFVLNKHYIENCETIAEQDALIEELNALEPIDTGFIYTHYCIGSESGRRYFSDENGQKIDAIRTQIEVWKTTGTINDAAYYFLIASLIESADKIANTASIYGSFLKELKKPAARKLVLTPADYEPSVSSHVVYQKDANVLIKEIEGDILYLDPPYNHRDYGANYHLLNTIALYDTFTPEGISGLRAYQKSSYCKKKEVFRAFEELIKQARFSSIFLSYNDEGLMNAIDIRKIMSKYGRYHLEKKAYRRFKADKTENRNHKADTTYEYLHILEKAY